MNSFLQLGCAFIDDNCVTARKVRKLTEVTLNFSKSKTTKKKVRERKAVKQS